MARNCNCAGSSCGCKIQAGAAITISGTGSYSDPYIVTNSGASLGTALLVNDTSTLDMVKVGAGTNADPIILSGNVTMKLQQLSDVSSPGGNPLATTTPVYVGVSGADGHWEFRSPFLPYATASRPSATAIGAGAVYYDTTLKKPAWSDGAVWRDAAGTAV